MNGMKCFLIDDDPDDLDIFAIALEDVDKSIDYEAFNNCLDALEKLKDKPVKPDFIFIDLNMPYLSGKECFKEIKKLHHLKDSVIIIYTTSASQNDIKAMEKMGANHFFVKPASIDRLTEMLLKIFNKQLLPFVLQ